VKKETGHLARAVKAFYWRVSLGVAGVVAVGALSLGAVAAAQTQELDGYFGEGGVAVAPVPSAAWNGAVLALAEDGQGRIVAAGVGRSGNFVLLRFSSDGDLDNSFRGGGFLERDPTYNGGLVETRFGGEARAEDLSVLADGRLLAVGSEASGEGPGGGGAIVLARYLEGGALDPGFGKGGKVVTPMGQGRGGASALAVQADGRILVAGFRETPKASTEGVLLRYRPDGRIDRSFGSGGEVVVGPKKGQARLTDVAVLGNGSILVAGGYRGDFFLARLLPSGLPDKRFGGGDGRVLTDVDGGSYCSLGSCALAISLDVNRGLITAAGNAATGRGEFAALVRFSSSGRLDRRFGHGGILRLRQGTELEVEQIAVQGDGRIVLAGHDEVSPSGIRAVVVRVLPSGRLDAGFGLGGYFAPFGGYGSALYSVFRQRDRKVLTGGYLEPSKPPPSELESPLRAAQFALAGLR
jgi:uncharacterized delta-60 repeat protein